MARRATLVAAALALLPLLAPPGLAWYKPAAGPRHYSVGRAAGLLSGFRRSPSAPAVGTARLHRTRAFPEPPPRPRTLAVCVQDVSPHLQSCERRLHGAGTFQCKADVLLSLREADCRGGPEPRPQPDE